VSSGAEPDPVEVAALMMIVRNRAARHEPIHRRDLARDFADAVTVVG
jgi:hypothetical protein